MLKLNASYSKKVPVEGDYSSQSYHNGIMITRNDHEAYNAVFKQGSYLAKVSQKENNPSNQRELFASSLYTSKRQVDI